MAQCWLARSCPRGIQGLFQAGDLTLSVKYIVPKYIIPIIKGTLTIPLRIDYSSIISTPQDWYIVGFSVVS